MAKQIAVDIRKKELRDFFESRRGTGRNTPIQYAKEIKRKEPEPQRLVQAQRKAVRQTPSEIDTEKTRRVSESKTALRKAFKMATK